MANLKEEVYRMINKINSESDLEEIAKLCKEKIAISLDEYVDIELKCAPNNIKNKFKCEVLDFYTDLPKDIETATNPCGEWHNLIVEGYELEDWIGNNYPVFNPTRLAICVYKIWNKEVIIK